jgi:hypothetical protein
MMDKKLVISILAERYENLLLKNYRYQMGDDEYQLTTQENVLVKAVQTIINDLRKERPDDSEGKEKVD